MWHKGQRVLVWISAVMGTHPSVSKMDEGEEARERQAETGLAMGWGWGSAQAVNANPKGPGWQACSVLGGQDS
jgi:hypothetical protein